MANAWEFVPWAIGGGAKHTTSMARLVAYSAFGGNEGIVGSKDLEVAALSTPGTQVRLFPGACSILNRTPNSPYEAYAARLPVLDYVDIAANNGTTTRSDLIIARVEDPFVSGSPWPAPTAQALNDQTAQFVRTAVVSNVGTGATTLPSGLGYSAIVLARVDVPANTATITQAMVTDLRKMIRTRSESQFNVVVPAANRILSATSPTQWPLDLGFTVDIPTWATHVAAKASLGGIIYTGSTIGYVRCVLGTLVLAGDTPFDMQSNGTERALLVSGGLRTAVPSYMRGTSVQGQTQAYKANTSQVNLTAAAGSSGCTLEFVFSQRPESNL